MSALTDYADDYLDNSPDPEEEGLDLFLYLLGRFGWTGTVLTRQDVVHWLERGLTDDEWERIQQTRYWKDASSIWAEVGVTWDTISMAVEEAGIEHE